MQTITSENGARAAGFTKAVFVDIGGTELSLYVRPHDDLDGEFCAFCRDESEMLRVNGWLADDISDNAEG